MSLGKWILITPYVLRKGIYANNFELSSKAVSAYNHSLNKLPLAIDFKDFKIETISNIAVKGDIEISGNINGNAIKNLNQPYFYLI
jgi:hypothetical protein